MIPKHNFPEQGLQEGNRVSAKRRLAATRVNMQTTLRLKRFFFLAVFLFAFYPLYAQSFWSKLTFGFRGSLLLFPEDNGMDSAPMPILPSAGGLVSYPFTKLTALEFSLDIYSNTWDYDYRLGRAVPANDEFRTSLVIGSILGVQGVFRFLPWGEKIVIRGYGGMSADLRICLLANSIDAGERHTNNNNSNTNHTVGEASQEIFNYFWGNFRWFFPFAGGGMDFRVSDGLMAGFDLRVWLPVWRLWTGENASFTEGFRFGLSFRVSFI